MAIAPNGLEVAMCIAATTDAQPVKHRPEIQKMGMEIAVEGPIKIQRYMLRCVTGLAVKLRERQYHSTTTV